MDAGVRSVAMGVAVAVTVVSAYALGSGGADDAVTTGLSPASAGEEADGGTGTIALRGTGERSGVPDQLSFRLSVRAKADDVTTALDDTSRTLRRVLAALEGVQVRRRDVQTTGLSVRPDYAYYSSGPPVLTGYVATQSVSVLVQELRDSGAAIAAAVEAGGNAVRVAGVRLRIGDRDALLADARDAAVAQARAKAEQYAAATGQTLGPVLSVREVHARGGRDVALAYGRAALDTAAAVPIRAGTEDLTVTVAVVWELG
ncbi:MAG: SIMPL domain-containing protein [Actinomycetes bacterium]